MSWNCNNCGKPQKLRLEILGKERVVPCVCQCREWQYQQEKAEEERCRKLKAVEKLKKYSLMDAKFQGCRLDAWDEGIGSSKLKKTIIRYIDEWPEMKANNVGLLIHGSPGIGKTYAAAALANEMMERHREVVVAVNTIGLLARIRETFGRYGKEAEIDIIRSLESASLLILDDLGAEQQTEWASAMLYQIIDSRYRSGKPLFITTNLELAQLKDKLTLKDGVDRTYDRIMEICLPIQVRGKSNRAAVGRNKREQLIQMLRKEN